MSEIHNQGGRCAAAIYFSPADMKNVFFIMSIIRKKGCCWGTCGGVHESMHYKLRGRERSHSRLKTETKRGSDVNMSASSNAWIKSFRHLTEAKQSWNDKLVSESEEEKMELGGWVCWKLFHQGSRSFGNALSLASSSSQRITPNLLFFTHTHTHTE